MGKVKKTSYQVIDTRYYFMACPVAHIIYVDKYFAKYSSAINKDEFILGCTFPDIRRIDEKIKRKETHLRFDPIDLDFSGFTPFQAG